MAFRSGFVSIIGRPNAGKSTLLNALVGEKLAIVTHKPQTTRNRILGIVTLKAKKGRPAAQMVLMDTPGVHKPDSQLGKRMMQEVQDALADRNLTLLIVDVTEKFGRGNEFVLDLVKRAGGKVFLLLNKIDRLEKGKLLAMIESYRGKHDFAEIVPISAVKGDGLEALKELIVKTLPEGPRYFPGDQITDQPERFIVAEIIREKVLMNTGEEVPYASAVVIEKYEEGARLTRIAAAIFCEREGQKAILIGKGGSMLKKIGSTARFEIERFIGKKVFLELFVKVRADWRSSKQFVEDLDWRRQLEDLSGGWKPED